MDLQLKGRTALITGGSRGIGFGVAQVLAAEGCNLHLASRSAADLETARGKLAAAAFGMLHPAVPTRGRMTSTFI